MFLLGLDIETTGLNFGSDKIVEMGAIVWDSERKKPIRLFNELINISPQVISVEAEKVTGITQSDIVGFGIELKNALTTLQGLSAECQFVVGHNILNFDLRFLGRDSRVLGVPNIDLPVIDTIWDLPLPESVTSRRLAYMAADHGILHRYQHRAFFDVLTTLELLDKYPLENVIEIASTPLIKVQAQVSYENKSSASNLGFRWDVTRRIWSKTMRRYFAERIKFPFAINIEEAIF